MRIGEMPRETIAQILNKVINNVDPEDAKAWESEASEHCLVTLSLPKGTADSAKKLFTKLCETCPDKDCDRKDTVTNEFFNAVFSEGLKSLM